MDTVKLIIEILSALSIAAASLVAIYGINTWRREFQGKRKIELAEDVLALFYEARDSIRAIRNPFGYSGEGSTRKAQENESPREKEARDRAYVAIERFQKREEVFNKLHTIRYRFMARFGRDKGEAFDDIRKVVNRILLSARWLSDLYVHEMHVVRDEERLNKHRENVEKYQKIFWEFDDNDEINTEVNRIIANMEVICEPIIMRAEENRLLKGTASFFNKSKTRFGNLFKKPKTLQNGGNPPQNDT